MGRPYSRQLLQTLTLHARQNAPRSELGRIMNRGAFCRACNVKVCKSCREYGLSRGNSGTSDWLCTICYKGRESQMATGEWIHDYLNRSGGGNPVKRNKSVNNGQRLYVA